MSELDTGTADAQSADDIRSSLAAALAESEAQETTPEPQKQDSVIETDADRARGPDGKFVKKEEPQEQPKEVVAAEKSPEDPQTVAGKEPPAHWAQADKDKFKAQAPEVQSFILDRFKAMEGDYTRKTQEIAHLKKEYGQVDAMFAPHRETLRQKGFTPSSLIEAWANVETKLAAGADSAVDVIKGLVGGYNIPVAKIASALGITTAAPAPTQGGDQPTGVENGQVVALPPEVQAELKALRDQVGSFGQKFQTIEQQQAASRAAQEQQDQAAVQKQIDEFKGAKGEKGELLHPHFDEVHETMNRLADVAIRTGQQPLPTLKEFYETAVWSNPSTREKLLTAQKQQDEAKRTEEARAKAASARKAGSSITGAPGSGQAPSSKQASELSLREQLEVAADEAA